MSDTADPVRELRRLIARLRIARIRQRSVALLSNGLLAGLLAGAGAALLARAGWLGLAPFNVAAVCVAVGAGAALLWSLTHRPSALDVAIRADLALALRQQVSTAWDFIETRPDAPVTRRLAARALSTRLTHRIGSVFPVRITNPTRLLPVGAGALIMVLVIDLPFETSRSVAAPAATRQEDRAVSNEGGYLREFAEQMQLRAKRELLARSGTQAAAMRDVAERMERGLLSRDDALAELRDLSARMDAARREALASGPSVPTAPMGATRDLSTVLTAAGARDIDALLRQLARGDLSDAELEALANSSGALQRLGITPEALGEALDNYRAGDTTGLRAMLEDAAERARNQADAEQLAQADDEINRSREQLGDPLANLDRVRRGGKPGDPANLEREENLSDADDVGEGGSPGSGQGEGLGIGDAPAENRSGRGRGDSGLPAITAAIRPTAQAGEGTVFSSPMRTLPEDNLDTLAPTPDLNGIATAFRARVAEVMQRDDVPAHRKAYIRAYFLALSQAEKTPRTAGSGPQGQRLEDQP
ncbi:MAG: hypothetical protein AAF458_08940 [Pseudomonadota bacterium]